MPGGGGGGTGSGNRRAGYWWKGGGKGRNPYSVVGSEYPVQAMQSGFSTTPPGTGVTPSVAEPAWPFGMGQRGGADQHDTGNGTPLDRMNTDQWAGTTGMANANQVGGFEGSDVYVTVPVDKVVVSPQGAASIAPTYAAGRQQNEAVPPGAELFPTGQPGKGGEPPQTSPAAGAFQPHPIGNPRNQY